MIIHKSVLLKEAIDGLNLKKGAIIVDATLGGGGHAVEILIKIGRGGKLIAIDQDESAIENFKKHGKPEVGNIVLAKDNFSNLEKILGGQGIKSVDGILADLGYSSAQMEDESYGLSFLKDAKLDMRLDKSAQLTAREIVNNYDRKDLERILREFGEEKFAGKIARAIWGKRQSGEIRGTAELAEIVKQAIPKKFQKSGQHPATKTFQALRIEVNQELENLKKFIPQAIKILKSGGRLAIISFHSLEDRIVKNIFRENARGCICPTNFPQCVCGREPKINPVKYSASGGVRGAEFNRVKIITKKPIVPGAEEILENPRARSAKLRVCEKV
ncbi:MAG: 16S rRNA (cytosine(1402)-N(4))-methyltransferase RsmH [Parcubacteria group bacterium]